MLWQLAYTELHITPVLWPDFTREHLFEAVCEFQRRERRFGRVTPPLPPDPSHPLCAGAVAPWPEVRLGPEKPGVTWGEEWP
jgi:hypothetical protein